MIVMINGSFGAGKTTIAKLLRRYLPGSAIYDPEWIGFFLRRLPGWIKLNGSGSDDYQDIDFWRRSTVAGIKLFRLFARGPLIVPMAFSRRDYFDEIVRRIEALDSELRVFCLKASLATVKRRLIERGTEIKGRALCGSRVELSNVWRLITILISGSLLIPKTAPPVRSPKKSSGD